MADYKTFTLFSDDKYTIITKSGRSDSMRRRSGKWSADEEFYAKQLITAFENGTLDDCEEGRTLRSYLAMKLNCAPMRISKKFAGQSIGKVRSLVCWTIRSSVSDMISFFLSFLECLHEEY